MPSYLATSFEFTLVALVADAALFLPTTLAYDVPAELVGLQVVAGALDDDASCLDVGDEFRANLADQLNDDDADDIVVASQELR